MAKGFRPTDDPDWRHDHVATGETRRCARKRCKVTWAVLCHNGSRIYCDTCARAVKRERDRADKQRIRKQARRNTDHSRAYLAVHAARAEAEYGTLPDLDEDQEDELSELELAEQIARLQRALNFARSVNDAQGVRVTSERLSALRLTRPLSA